MLSFRSYTKAIDMWSVGCIFAELLGGKPFFKGHDYVDQLYKILNVLGTPSEETLRRIGSQRAQDYVRSLPFMPKIPFSKAFPDANPEALDLLERMLTFDPADRITVEQALEHPYLKIWHDPADEPTCPQEFDFSFEEVDDMDQMRKMIIQEVSEFREMVRKPQQTQQQQRQQEQEQQQQLLQQQDQELARIQEAERRRQLEEEMQLQRQLEEERRMQQLQQQQHQQQLLQQQQQQQHLQHQQHQVQQQYQLGRKGSISIPSKHFRDQDQPPRPKENLNGESHDLEGELELGLDARR